jgi:hypothetical protein
VSKQFVINELKVSFIHIKDADCGVELQWQMKSENLRSNSLPVMSIIFIYSSCLFYFEIVLGGIMEYFIFCRRFHRV